MKKLIILTLSFCMINTSVPLIHAVESITPSDDECEPCKIKESELEEAIYQNKIYDNNGELESFEVVVPLPEGEIPQNQGRGIISALISIVVGAYKSCKVTWISTGGFNPCTYLAGALGRKIVNGVVQWSYSDRGSWKVSQTSTYGRIPGCEPMHAQVCYGWYYTYSYSRA